jgi:hypothetical protein
MLFKKRPLSDIFVKDLSPIYGDITKVIINIDGFITDIHEVGIFIASIATLKIISLEVENPEKLADEFKSKWIDYIYNTYKVENQELGEEKPDKEFAIFLLQDRFEAISGPYIELFLKAIDISNGEKKMYDATVLLAMILFTNCTEKQTPTNFSGFLLLTVDIKKSALNILEKIKISEDLTIFKKVSNLWKTM